MTVATATKYIEKTAHDLARISVSTPAIDAEQLARFATLNTQIENFGVTDLTTMSDEELLADLLRE